MYRRRRGRCGVGGWGWPDKFIQRSGGTRGDGGEHWTVRWAAASSLKCLAQDGRWDERGRESWTGVPTARLASARLWRNQAAGHWTNALRTLLTRLPTPPKSSGFCRCESQQPNQKSLFQMGRQTMNNLCSGGNGGSSSSKGVPASCGIKSLGQNHNRITQG